jgi:hypothetical protein
MQTDKNSLTPPSNDLFEYVCVVERQGVSMNEDRRLYGVYLSSEAFQTLEQIPMVLNLTGLLVCGTFSNKERQFPILHRVP